MHGALGPSGEILTNPQARALRDAVRRPGPRGQQPRRRQQPADAAEVAAAEAGLPDPTARAVASPFFTGVTLTADPDWHLARRISPGPTAALVSEIKAQGRAAWLSKQLAPASISDSACNAVLASLPAASMTASQAVLSYYTYDTGWKIAPTVVRATLIRRMLSNRHLLESMVEFWHDLLHVTAESDKAAYWIGDYDTFAIRRNALGKFATLLYAATTHPAMLDYLDNSLSTKDAPNENLGRELLELHTLGVGNFTEDDVKAATLLLTGFYADWDTMTGRFDPANHHVGPVTIAGITHANPTAAGGPAALAYVLGRLARHRATATRLCTRLAVRFVSDTPPAGLITRLTDVYLANDTAIVPVLRALFTSPEFASATGKKWRRPSELLVTMVRSGRPTAKPINAAAAKENPYDVLGNDSWLLYSAGHEPLNWPPPDGYPDVAARWMHTNGMLMAWNMSESVVENWDEGYTLLPWTKALGVTATMTPRAVARRVVLALTGFAGDATILDQLTRYLWSGDPAGAAPPSATSPIGADRLSWHLDDTVRIAMSSPYFQVR